MNKTCALPLYINVLRAIKCTLFITTAYMPMTDVPRN